MGARYLQIGQGLRLPAHEAQTETIVVYGGKGMGKTNFGTVLAEELNKCNLRFSWLDPVGVAWGLKHSGSGRDEGIEVLILGGIHGDIPIHPNAGAIVADLVVDEDVSVIVDISRDKSGRMWSKGEKIRFVRDYCVRLYSRQGERRRPLMQIIDEAGRFVPQQMQKGAIDIAECVGAIEELVELGRNVGVGVVLITQRSARMNKSVSELAEMMVAFRTVGPRSIDAIVDWFGEHKRVVRAELEQQLRALPRGTALIVSPGWLGIEGEYPIRQRLTFDSSATPRAGQERRPVGKGATPDLEKYRSRMAETIEKATENDPKALQKQVRDLQGELRKMKAQAPAETVKVEQVEIEVPVLPDHLLERIVYALERGEGLVSELEDFKDGLLAEFKRVRDGLASIQKRPVRAPQPVSRAKPRLTEPPPVPRPAGPQNGAEPVITGPAQRVLDALAWLEIHGLEGDRVRVAFLAGYSPKTGHYQNTLSNLRRDGLVDYPSGRKIRLTDEGRRLAQAPETATTTEELQGAVFARLSGPQQRVLRQLVATYPDPLSREVIAEGAGFSPKTGHYQNTLSSLKSLGLITYPDPGHAKAEPVLFLEERV